MLDVKTKVTAVNTVGSINASIGGNPTSNYETQLKEANAIGRENLAEHGVELGTGATTYDIMSNIAKIPPLAYVNTFEELYLNAKFPEDTELIIDVGERNFNLTSMFEGAQNLTKVKIQGPMEHSGLTLTNAFKGNSLIIVDFTEIGLNVISMTTAFNTQQKLTKILGEFDFSELIDTGIVFTMVKALEEIRIKPNTLSVGLTMLNSPLLSAESIQSIIDGLATVEEQKILKLHSSVVEKLTEEQVAQIANKNWNVG